ncbi:uncharacterized protein LOC124130300 isoform X2 [Haliotis rufescens]|uniref:uncharacterized protein LOC124130300 isoform X2 n=1 Tax=Haliotis rufescens TaxID=6454 RepID=UPI00201EDA93|nr:uncharacterized protein LOC124130300 isoform X2 [Haliotis rufescens]
MSGMKLGLFTTPLLVFTVLSVPSSPLTITETSEGCHRILYCQETKDNDTVLWYKNNLEIMETSKDSYGSNSSVSLRDVQDGTTLANVSVSEKRHSLTLMVSLLFGKSVWRCETVHGVSENLTLDVTGLTKESGIQYNLTSAPATAVEGNPFKLSCIHASGLTLTTALWYRNCVEIFQTNGNLNKNQMLSTNYHNIEFRSVSQRVTVESDRTRHRVTLIINSTLDEGSVWTCGTGQTVSNSITVILMEPITEESSTPTSSTDRQTTSRQTTRAVMDTVTKDDRPSAQGEPLIYAIAGSAGGFLLLVCILIIACISRRRSRGGYILNFA